MENTPRYISFMPSLLKQLQLELLNNGIVGPGIIRNFSGLPQKIYSNDIDIICMPSERETIENLFKLISKRLELQFIKYDSMYYTNKYLFKKGQEELEIDVNFLFNWYGVQFFEIKQLYKHQITKEGFVVLGTEDERIFITFCHSFLYGGFINRKYLTLFRSCINSPHFCSLMRHIFTSDTPRILHAISSDNRVLSRNQINLIRIRVIFNYFLRRFICYFKNLFA